MNDAAYAGLRRASRAGEPDPKSPETEAEEGEDEMDAEAGGKKKKDKEYMTEDEHKAAVAKATAEATAAANARFSAVLASEHYAGREALATKLLGNDKLSADEIIDTLSVAACAPKASNAASSQSADDAARAEMQAALNETTNSNADADAGSGGKPQGANASDVWSKAHANLGIKVA